MASPTGRFSIAAQSKIMAAAAFTGSVLPSWDDTEIDTLPAHIVKPASVKLGLMDMETKSLDLASLSSGLSKLTTGTLDTLTLGASDKLLDEVGAGDLADSFKHRWVVLWRHPDLTRGPYQLIWYESEKAKQPSGFVELTRGAVTITNPTQVRKGHPYSFELAVKDDEDDDGDFRATFSTETFLEKVAWMNILEDYNGEEEFVDNEDIRLYAALPKMHHLDYKQLPANVLAETALKCGYIHKQGKGGAQQFKKRWFVLWHHPASVEDGWTFLWYDDQDSNTPNDYKLLKVGDYNVSVDEDSKKNKKKKKYGDRFKIEISDDEGTHKYVLATDNSLELDDWVEMLMSQEDVNGQRASAMATATDFGDDEDTPSLGKLLEEFSKPKIEGYMLPVRPIILRD
jgi:hypothetical protein